MAAPCATPQLTTNAMKSRAGANTPKRQPRDELLRIPRRNTLRQAAPIKTPQHSIDTLPRLPPPSRRGSDDVTYCSGSPKAVEHESSAGAKDVNRKTCQCSRSCRASHETPHSKSRTGVSPVSKNYLIYDQSPQVTTLSHVSNPRPDSQTIAPFEFGVTFSKPVYQLPRPRTEISPAHMNSSRGVRTDKALPSLPAQETTIYSLFPGILKGSTDHSIRPPSLRTSDNASYSVGSSQSGMIDPVRPRKASLPSSVRSRADSCISTRIFPSVTIIPGNKSLPHAGNLPRIPLPIRVSESMPTSPPSIQSATSTSSRWSGDTITRSLDDSERSSIQGRASTSSSSCPPWPHMGSFFEDDDDEQVPLRRTMATRIRGARAWSPSSASSTTMGSGDQKKEWYQRWVTCCAGIRRN